jgi:hypothetical protein
LRRSGFSLLLIVWAAAAAAQEAAPRIPAERLSAAITPQSLEGHVSFLSSDLLEGRATPSRGLEIAAEYIASQFRSAGLKPAGSGGYFQIADLKVARANLDGFEMSVQFEGQTIGIAPSQVSLGREIYEGLDLLDVAAVKVPFGEHRNVTRDQVEGKVVLTQLRDIRSAPAAEQAQWFADVAEFRNAMRLLGPALIVNVNPDARTRGPAPPAYTDAQMRRTALRSMTVSTPELARAYEAWKAGPLPARVSVHVSEPEPDSLTARNVIGVLRGSGEALRDTYLLISAHYDHVGTRSYGEDRIYNGANDNASGVAALIELAHALSAERPRRSIVFIAYFGEEQGLIGSRYYAAHPVFPLSQTIANINLEHLGRTDDREGSQAGKATLTGYEYSDAGARLRAAAAAMGYEIYNREGNEMYFERSDNAPLAEAGVPAHTAVVTFEFPDYHEPGDEWQKLDYANMERVVEALAAGAFALADSAEAPQWNAEKAKRYAPRAAPAQ